MVLPSCQIVFLLFGGPETGGTGGPETAVLRKFAVSTIPRKAIPPGPAPSREPAS